MENPKIDEKIIFLIENKELICNKTNLIKNSEYFRTMFGGNFVENNLNKIELKEIEYKTMEMLEKCLWDVEIIERLDNEFLIEIYKATNMFLMENLKDYCYNQIIKRLTIDNCIELWQLGQYYHDNNLIKRAKFLAILEFEQIRKQQQISLIDLETILEYLSSRYLQTDNEINVFDTALSWYNENYPDNHQNDEILVKLLFCLDFNRLTLDDINRIQSNIANYQVYTILDCVKLLRNLRNFEKFDRNFIDVARNLLRSKSRISDGIPCLLATPIDNSSNISIVDAYKRKRKCTVLHNLTIIYLDPLTENFKTLIDIDADFQEVQGYNIISYRQFIYIFGGEEIIGKGPWKQRGWKYDMIRNTSEYFDFPFKRRHFQCCIVGNYLFIIGGFGQYRIYQHNLFYYDLINKKWSNLIILPTASRSIKCCCFQQQLVIFDLDNRGAHHFHIDGQSWKSNKFTNFDRNDVLMKISYEKTEMYFAINQPSVLCNNNLYFLNNCDTGTDLRKFSIKQRCFSEPFFDNNVIPIHTGVTTRYYRVTSNLPIFKSFIIDFVNETINQRHV